MTETTEPLQVVIIHLADEIPKFRSGERRITVLSLGPKWVRLQCRNKKVRVPRDLWMQLLVGQAKYQNRVEASALITAAKRNHRR